MADQISDNGNNFEECLTPNTFCGITDEQSKVENLDENSEVPETPEEKTEESDFKVLEGNIDDPFKMEASDEEEGSTFNSTTRSETDDIICTQPEKRQKLDEDATDNDESVNEPYENMNLPKRMKDDPYIRLVILAHRSGYINFDQAMALRNELIRHIDEVAEDAAGPRFVEVKLLDGMMFVGCADVATKTWLEETLKKLNPWKDIELKIVNEKELHQKLIRAKVFITGPIEPVATILRRLEIQNKPFISTDNWKIVDVRQDKRGQMLFIRIPESSWTKLEEMDFKPFINFSKVKFTPVKKAEKHANVMPRNLENKNFKLTSEGHQGRKNKSNWTSHQRKTRGGFQQKQQSRSYQGNQKFQQNPIFLQPFAPNQQSQHFQKRDNFGRNDGPVRRFNN